MGWSSVTNRFKLLPDKHLENEIIAMKKRAAERYWKTNLIVITILLSIWAVVSCLCGVLFIDQLNAWSIGKLPLGFWFANQGSMITFVVLILVYAVVMDFADRRYLREVDQHEQEGESK